jgi:hypothetical membrane protein
MFKGSQSFDRVAWAGAMLFLAGTVALMGIITAETLYPGYNTADNMISDLGATEPPNSVIVQPSSNIFSASMAICGLLVLGGTFILHGRYSMWCVTLPMTAFGIGVLGVGIFNGSWGTVHALFAMTTFIGGGMAAIMTFRIVQAPFRYVTVALGAISLFVLFSYMFMGDNSPFMELGEGGLERWVAYPVLLWALGLGGHLMGQRQAESKPQRER